MRDRSKSLNTILLSVFLILIVMIPFGEGVPIIVSIFEEGLTDWFSVPFILLFVVIILNLLLLKIKKDYYILSKILFTCQTLLLIFLLVEYFYVLVFMAFTLIMLTISLLQMINVFVKSTRVY